MYGVAIFVVVRYCCIYFMPPHTAVGAMQLVLAYVVHVANSIALKMTQHAEQLVVS